MADRLPARDRGWSDADQTLLDRLTWIVRLHWIAASFIFVRALILSQVIQIPGIALAAVSIVGVVFASNLAVVVILRRWQQRPFAPLPRVYRTILNAQAVLDIFALATSVKVRGGAESLALPLTLVPLMVAGSFVRRRDAYAHAALTVTLLGGIILGEHMGWLQHACARNLPCTLPPAPVALARFLTVATIGCLASYLTSVIGEGMRLQEAEARRLAEDRGELAKVRARFVAMVSHEFRTPLATIQAACSLLVDYGARLTDVQRAERGEKITAQIAHMTQLLEDVLELGRAAAGAATCLREPVDIAALCRDALEQIEATVGRTHQLVLDSHSPTPAVSVDPRLVRQILTNLLGNAAKYSPAGSTVTLSVETDEHALRLRVEDHGIGIAPADQAHLFEPFQRGGNVGRIPGTGLGLAITRPAVEQHGGTIAVASAVGEGTTFDVTLPLRDPARPR